MLIASPHWRRRAYGTIRDQFRFLDEVSRRISYPYTDHPEFGDAIAHWAIADSWRPPSSPTNTYSPARIQGVIVDRAWAPDYERIEGAIWHSKRTDEKLLDQTAREMHQLAEQLKSRRLAASDRLNARVKPVS